MVEASLALMADKPLSFQKPVSQVARELIHIERKVDQVTGEVISEEPRLNRKGRRKKDALERRKFKPATRRLTKLELRELMLNKYEDSLETKQPKHTAKQKKKKRSPIRAEHSVPDEQPQQSRARRFIQRATDRAIDALGF